MTFDLDTYKVDMFVTTNKLTFLGCFFMVTANPVEY